MDGPSVSRASSISRVSSRRSTRSRSQSLIRKNVAAQDLRPSDILIERFVAWKVIVRQLISYFEGIAEIQNNTARELTKLGAVIQVPFKAGNQFLGGEDGLQDIFYSVRDKTRIVADQHANLGRTIDSSIVQHLVKLRSEIKAHIRNIQHDTGRLATSVAKERELSTKLMAELTSAISSFQNTPMGVTNKTDPYVANTLVIQQLRKQVHEENLLQKSIIIMQQNSAHFEEGIVKALQSAWQTYDEWQTRMALGVADTHRGLAAHFASLAPDREWIAFSARSDHLLDPETPLRSVEHIKYPHMEDTSVVPVHIGNMERKKRFTRTYRESYYVLTAAGFLHEYVSSDPANAHSPIFSLFLPACTLGPPSSNTAKSHKFHIEGRKDGQGTTKAGSLRASIRSIATQEHAYAFRCRSREDMMSWWNDIRMLCARYLVASESMDRTGPITAAVRGIGYQSDDSGSDVEDEEGEGSSVVEEDDDEGMYAEADEGLPSYSRPHSGIIMGANGYPIEKKRSREGLPHSDGENISRRPSRRQQEKAPEGKPPHAYDEEEQAPEPARQGKFQEQL